jgi:citrate synthase
MTELKETDEEVRKGLEGVIATETKIGYVNGKEGRLSYRGYDITTLAEQSNFEEVSYLLLHGNLPNREEYENFVRTLREKSDLNNQVISLIKEMSDKVHPMTTLRTAVSYLASFDEFESSSDHEKQIDIGINLIAKMPAIVGSIHRAFMGEQIVKSDKELGLSANFFYMSLGKKPDPIEAKIIDTALLIHADHGMNASTFSALVTASTMADMYSSITSAISTLKGPLHGGANERALKMIQSMKSPANVDGQLKKMVDNGEKIMGFGHRVYKVYDPRAKILKKYAEYLTEKSKDETFKTAEKIEELMINKFGERGIFPNVDFYSGMIYNSLGFKTEIFTPIFATGRISGWVARVLEYMENNKLFRPKAKYTGPKGPLKYIPIQDRD